MKHEIQMGRGDTLFISNINGKKMAEIQMWSDRVYINACSDCVMEEPGVDCCSTTISLPKKSRKNQTKLEKL